MLSNPTIMAILPTTKPKQSKAFYSETIGLKLVSEDDYALVFTGNGVTLRITTVHQFTPFPFTALGFQIEEIESQVKSLIKKGVEFKRYESLEQDNLGIWNSPSTARVAWFEDPDGNLISLTEC